MTAADASPFERFALGDVPLQHGGSLRAASLAYRVYGTLDASRSNAIVVPTAYGGTHLDNEWLIGPGRPLDTDRYFVVAPNLFGAGLSTSPSNAHHSQAGAAFPLVSVYDNVEAQLALVNHLAVTGVALVTGFSMGAMQAFHWAARVPRLVARIAPFCGTPRTSEHNIVFLEGMAAALACGRTTLARVWAAWGLSQTFYREERWRELGFATRDAFVRSAYVASFEAADPHDLLAMLRTWLDADVGSLPIFGGDTRAALAACTSRAVVMPCETDLYFPPEDCALAVAAMPHAELAVIPGPYGHASGGNLDEAASRFIATRIAALLRAGVGD